MSETTTPVNSGSGLDPKIIGLLCWIFAPITSIIFLLIEKDKFVKFHAWESLIWGVAGFVISGVLGTIMAFTIILACLSWVPSVLWFVISIVGAIKAYNGEMWKLPVIGDFAEQQAGK